MTASNVRRIVGDQAAIGDARFALIAARFNGYIVDSLVQGATDTLIKHGVPDDRIVLVEVPGALELPLAASRICRTEAADAVIALGAVIRGATAHFDYVCSECVRGLGQVGLETGIPVIFGVLTTNNVEQAIARAAVERGNKGGEAALAALEMTSLMARI